jgi:hypothetical protein
MPPWPAALLILWIRFVHLRLWAAGQWCEPDVAAPANAGLSR